MNGLSTAVNCLGQYYDQFATLLNPSEVAQIELLSYKLEHRVIEIAVFGLVSTGKTTLLNALLGRKIGATSPLNGTTQGLATQTWSITAGQGKAQIRFIDTPGLDEIDGAQRSELTFAVAERVDLILFVVAGDLNDLELTALQGLQQKQKPILLIINKADLYLEPEKLALQTAITEKLLTNHSLDKSKDKSRFAIGGVVEIVFTAAAPLPRLVRYQYSDGSATQETWENPLPDVAAVQLKILDLLNREGKDLVALNVMGELAKIQHSVIQRYLKPLPQWIMALGVAILGLSTLIVISPAQWLDAFCFDIGLIFLCFGLVRYSFLSKLWQGSWFSPKAIAPLSLPLITLIITLTVMVLPWLMPQLISSFAYPQPFTGWFGSEDGLEIISLIVSLPLITGLLWWQIQQIFHHPKYDAQIAITQILTHWQPAPQTQESNAG